MTQDSNLVALEALMSEFFEPTTTNVRKKEIESLLTGFENQTDAWKLCLEFMVNTRSHYVCMFALNTLETIIHKRWVGLPGSQHAEIRNTLKRFLVEHYKSAPSFIRNKLIKLIVDIARTDWPHFYPDFFPTMMDFIHDRDTMLLGLNMLLITSEELATPRADLPSSRKEELRRLLGAKVPEVLSTLTNILSTVLEKHLRKKPANKCMRRGGYTTTPPPSPLHNSGSNAEEIEFTTSPVHDGSLLHVASHKLMNSGGLPLDMKPLDSEAEEVSALALQILTHLFTWIPLSTHITPHLLHIVFQFASMGAKIQDPSETPPADAESCKTKLGILAMDSVNEIMSKNCIPADFENYLLQMFKSAFQLLQEVVHESSSVSPEAKIRSLDDTFVDKLTEFLRLFVGTHIRRFECNPNFPVLEFLALIFKFTFLQTRLESYYTCLNTWSTFVEYISNCASDRKTEGAAIVHKYQEALLALVTEILRSMQFKSNWEALEDIDDSTIDEHDKTTEWQVYLTNSIETIMKVAEVLPEDVLRILYVPWEENFHIYASMDKHVIDRKLNIYHEEELKQLHFILKDFATLLRLIGRVSSLFVGEYFLARIQEGQGLFRQLIATTAQGSKTRFYALPISMDLSKAFIEVQAQTFAALKAWCHWLSSLHTIAIKNHSYDHQCRELTNSLMSPVALVVKECQSKELVHSASHFLVTLTGTVRPPSIWKVKEFTDLYSSLGGGQLTLSPEDHRLMVRALSNVLMLFWPGISDQRWEERQRHLSKFLRDITVSFRQIKSVSDFPSNRQLQVDARPMITTTLRVIGDLVENVLDESTQTKKLCFDCVQEYIHISLWLFPIYIADDAVCEELFTFFHIVFDVLKAQMGAHAVEEAIQTFMSLFDKEHLVESIRNETGGGSKAVEKFLGILEFIVKEPDSSFRKFIPSTINLCLNHIYPLVAEKPTSDIKGPLYSLLFNVLMHNQRYFFKPSVVRSLGAPSSQGEVLNRDEFIAIMHAFGQSFLQPDVSIFRQNLKALEELNGKWKLYHKSIFTECLIEHFLTVLLQVLVHRSHDLLREEILMCVFNMANVDFHAFVNEFVVRFIDHIGDLDENQKCILKTSFKSDSDFPSFTANIDRLVNDIRYYRLCNASLPVGSVQF